MQRGRFSPCNTRRHSRRLSQLIHGPYIARPWSIGYGGAGSRPKQILPEFLSRLSPAREFLPRGALATSPRIRITERGRFVARRETNRFLQWPNLFPQGGKIAGSGALHRRRTSALQQLRSRYNLPRCATFLSFRVLIRTFWRRRECTRCTTFLRVLMQLQDFGHLSRNVTRKLISRQIRC